MGKTLVKHLKINSDKIVISGLKRFIGKEVEIKITEVEVSQKEEWIEKLLSLAGKITIDEKEIMELREISRI